MGKDLLTSVTFWGLIIGIGAQVAARYGVTVDQAGLANDVVTAVGAIMAAVGRVRMKHAITSVAGIPVKPAVPPGPPPAAMVFFVLPGLGLALLVALALSACASDQQKAAGQTVPVTLIQACNGYGAALHDLAAARAMGKLNADMVRAVHLVDAQVGPICTAPAPAGAVGTLVPQVLAGTGQLMALLANPPTGPPIAGAPDAAVGADATGGVR